MPSRPTRPRVGVRLRSRPRDVDAPPPASISAEIDFLDLDALAELPDAEVVPLERPVPASSGRGRHALRRGSRDRT